MVIALNETWKVPVGYFFVYLLSTEQIAELVKQFLLLDCKTTITNLLFDKACTNCSAARIVGCKLKPNHF